MSARGTNHLLAKSRSVLALHTKRAWPTSVEEFAATMDEQAKKRSCSREGVTATQCVITSGSVFAFSKQSVSLNC